MSTNMLVTCGSFYGDQFSHKLQYQLEVNQLSPYQQAQNTAHNGTFSSTRARSIFRIRCLNSFGQPMDSADLFPASSWTSHSGARPPHARRAQERRNSKRTSGYMRYMDEFDAEGGCANKSGAFLCGFFLRQLEEGSRYTFWGIAC